MWTSTAIDAMFVIWLQVDYKNYYMYLNPLNLVFFEKSY